MIQLNDFLALIGSVLNRDLNEAQRESILHGDERNLLIVAGPGSGKTTVLVLRALRHVFVDGLLPEHVLITTFTTKAAKELRTRWLDWGSLIVSRLRQRRGLGEALERVDLNRCRIDTLDSVAQQVLAEYKPPGEIPHEVIEEATANLVLRRRAFSEVYGPNQATIDPLLARYGFDGDPPRNRGEALQIVKTLCDRLIQDRVNLDSYSAVGNAQALVVDMAETYWQRLTETGLLDFASLEYLFLQRICNGVLDAWLGEIRSLLIDEYQDTNPLQEDIYFQLIRRTDCRVTVVGDDDQAMYRFRGGTVELFTQFAARCERVTARATRRLDMVTNYRSPGEIVSFYNAHITGDPQFTLARINPSKPEVIASRGNMEFPVLGMFRQSPEDLARTLAAWLDNLFSSRRFTFNHRGGNYELRLEPANAFGDCVLLSHTVDEFRYQGFGQDTAEIRFPGMLRETLIQRQRPVFNPRGRSLRTIPNVQRLLGLVLLALDPDGRLTADDEGFHITREARYYLNEWRGEAGRVLIANPLSRSNSSLQEFVRQWQRASRGEPVFDEPDWPILELLFKLITWLPEFQNDPEHQVWLEAVTRAVASAGIESAYHMQIHQRGEHRTRSRQILIRDGFVPIAQDEVSVDEDIMPSVPRNRLQLMTIHQAKGLEFPLVIVDVGSAFTRNHPKQAFRRFPRGPSNVAFLEDDMDPHLPAAFRANRSGLDRTFDDLVRLYYVAYSRPQSVLLLVGCEQCLRYGTGANFTGAIPHIGLGWHRDRSWPWRQPRPPRGGAPVRVEPPFAII